MRIKRKYDKFNYTKAFQHKEYPMALGGLLDKAKDIASKTKNDTSEKAASFKETGLDKISEIISDLEAAIPFIKTAGYSLTEVDVELGLSPKLVPQFMHEENSANDVERAIEELKDNVLGKNLLLGLIKAAAFQKKISIAGLVFSHIEISLSIIPSIRLQYKGGSVTDAKAISSGVV